MNDIDLVGHLGAAIDRARARVTNHEQLGDTTDFAEQGTRDEGVQAGSVRLDAGKFSACTTNSPSLVPVAGDAPNLMGGVPAPMTEPMTELELDAIVTAVWADLEQDPFRVGDLLADAIGFIGRIAVAPDTDPYDADRAAGLLRRMEQRALWGPTEPKPDVRLIWSELP